MSEDRRQHERVPVRTVVRMTFQTIGDFLQSYAQNISEGGMQLAVAQELKPGDDVGLEFKLKSNYPLIVGAAQVRWCRRESDHWFVGVNFTQLDERSQRVITEAVALRAKSSGPATPEVEEVGDDLLLPPVDEDAAPARATPAAPPARPTAPPPPPPAPEKAPEIESLDFGDLSVGDAAPEAEIEDVGDLAPADEAEVAAPVKKAAANEVESFDFDDLDVGAGEDTATSRVEDLFDDTAVAGEPAAPTAAPSAPAPADPSRPTIAAAKPAKRAINVKLLGAVLGGVAVIAAAAALWVLRGGEEPAAPVMATKSAPGPRPSPRPATAPADATAAAAVSAPAPATAAVATSPLPTSPAQPARSSPPAQHAAPAPNVPPAPAVAKAPVPPATAKPAAPQPAAALAPAPVAKPSAPAKVIVGAQGGDGSKTLLRLRGDGNFDGQFKFFGLNDPPRAVVDVRDVELRPEAKRMASVHPAVRDIRVGIHPDKVRIVVDLDADRAFRVRVEGSDLVVELE